MEQTTLKKFYDELFYFFDNNCKKVDHMENLAGANVLVIAVGVKAQIESLISYLNQKSEQPDHIFIIIQKNMMPVVRDLENDQCHFIEWEGPYTWKIVDHVSEKIDLSTIRYLFYQGRQPLNHRDLNLYDILLGIKKKYESDQEMRIYIQDIQEYVHWYRHPEKIRKGMDVYQAVDTYLEE